MPVALIDSDCSTLTAPPTNLTMSPSSEAVPKIGPEPTLLSRTEVDALYDTLEAVLNALKVLGVDAIVTGGSLLGAVRQHSILFCDDDIDITIVDHDGKTYETIVRPKLQEVLGKDYDYRIRPWEGGDKIRPKRVSNIFVDLFVMRRFDSLEDFKNLIRTKKNGQPQTDEYVQDIVDKMEESAFSQDEFSPLCPFWHFTTRKAVEMWTKEVYRESELLPLDRSLKMGPVTGISGPRMPVKLLKRAFGQDVFDVYYQSFSHKMVTKPNNHHKENAAGNGLLPPLVSAGGTWEGGVKTTLEDKHYKPMQPVARAKRRPTLHCKEALQNYLVEMTTLESSWTREELLKERRPNRTVYMDGVFDMLHLGHLRAIEKCAALGNRVIIGVTGDVDATGYKREPIVPESERVALVKALEVVDSVVCPCPLVVTEEFMLEHSIDLVVHGFVNEQDCKRQEQFFEIPVKQGKFQGISYYRGLSTTDRIAKIQALETDSDAGNKTKPQWFGATLTAVIDGSSSIPYDPFPLDLRQAIEPHIEKARKRSRDALGAIRQATGECKYDSVLSTFRKTLAVEGELEFDVSQHLIRQTLLDSWGLNATFDLTRVHETVGLKQQLLHTLTGEPKAFQRVFDEFVRAVCAPQMDSVFPCDEIYYQSFPCLRMIQPDEFSIGPHGDVAYGHHPCSVNFYLPLTEIGGTSSVFLESRPGAEDWHPIEGQYGYMKRFAGSICMHWTTDNKTEKTRVSLDFRLIPGPLYDAVECGGTKPGGQKDVYRKKDGYYSRCRKEYDGNGNVVWTRQGELLKPDARIGFPWTVKDWSKILQRQ